MKEVSCNTAGTCKAWCHAATPHPVNEACERSYCMEVRRQVKCEPVPVTTPPDGCTRRTRDLCDLSGMPCAIVYDGVTCRAGRPGYVRIGDASGPHTPLASTDDLQVSGILDPWPELPAEGTRWQTKDDRGNPLLLQWSKGSWVKVEAPATSTAAVYESSVRSIIGKEIWLHGAVNSIGCDSIAGRATARIVALPRVEADATDTMRQAFRSKKIAVIIREAIDALHDGTKTPAGHIRRAVDRIIALPKWTPRIRQEGGTEQ
ncbi:hypothetical protein LCGC14_1537370 [marine sediment metagenome]|uniref:Uncharacterized protein n=1 Tax=marine sediment metagenome TaxID=412755 RepID=A0A0F9IU42_9ZZZZ